MSNHRAVRPKTPELGDFKPAADPRRAGGSKRPKAGRGADMPSAPPSAQPSEVAVQPESAASLSPETVAPVMDMPAATPFQLSRIYSKGWHAGMTHEIDDSLAAIDARGESLNPCGGAIERARWTEGFGDAVRRKLASPARRQPQFRTSFGG